MNISGNTILITGGTSGIGRGLAEALHAKGNKVIVAGRRQELLNEITKANEGMVGLQLDQTSTEAIGAFAKKVKEEFPQLNVLINNAGIARLENYTADQVETKDAFEIIQTNITGVVELTAALLPTLRAQPKSTLMVTTSGLAFVAYPPAPVYSATKAFMHNWLDGIRYQLRNTDVEVLELAPPYVQTELGGPQQASDPRAVPLKDFVHEVIEILEGNKIENGEILVEHVKPLRWAEKNGQYQQMVEMLGSM